MHYWQRYLCFTMTCVTTYLCLDTFLLLIFPNITLFIYGLFYGSSVHHGYSKPWCLSKHLGLLPYPWIWCCHRCGVWKKTRSVTHVTPYSSQWVVYCCCAIFHGLCMWSMWKFFEYNSDRGLCQHQLNCEEFLQANNEASTVDCWWCLGKISMQAPEKKAQCCS